MVAVAGSAPSETTEPGDLYRFVEVDLPRCTDGELVDRLLQAQRMRARLDAAVVAITGVFDARLVWAGDGARSTPAWVTARVGASYGAARGDLQLARDLRDHPHLTRAARQGRLTRDQTRALLGVRTAGLEEVFDACEEILIDEIATATLAAGRRFLARWAQEVRERFGIGEPDGPEPDGGDRSRAHLSPVGDRWAGELDLTAEDGEKVANAIDNQIDALWNQGVFTTSDDLTPAERRAIALVQVIERGTRGGGDGTARPLIFALTTLDTLAQNPNGHANGDDGEPGGEPDGDPASTSRSDDPTSVVGDHDNEADAEHDNDPAGRNDRTDDETSHRSAHCDPAGGTAPSGCDCGCHQATDDTRTDGTDPQDTITTGTPPPPWLLPRDGTGSGSSSGAGPDPDPLADLDPLTPYPALLAELSRSGPVHPDIVRRLACEGAVIPVYIGSGADQLNMGRTLRIANRPNAAPYASATAAVSSPAAPSVLSGASPTTSCGGRTAGPPTWSTWCCCAGSTTRLSTAAGSP